MLGLFGGFGEWVCCSLRREVWGWALFYAGITAVAFGSAHYHLQPEDDRVMWDTLPVRITVLLYSSLVKDVCVYLLFTSVRN